MTDPAKHNPIEFRAWFEWASADEQDACVIGTALALGYQVGEENSERGEALRCRIRDLSAPVDSEFYAALSLAYEKGVTKPLRDYVASGKPIPQNKVRFKRAPAARNAAEFVDELLGGRGSPLQGRGRPRRIPSQASPREQAVRNAAWLAASC